LPTDDTNDTYSVDLSATIGREPPPGESWSGGLTNHNQIFLDESGEILDPDEIDWEAYNN